MELKAYYEGADSVKDWLTSLLGRTDIIYEKLPTSNNSSAFTKLPAYVTDILYLDKPDIIISGSIDGEHEKPIFSIEFAGCTPQYQHALQRFSRMMASVVNGCPSIIILPLKKREVTEGARVYHRSRAIEYGAVRLMDIFRTPAFIFDWEDDDGNLLADSNLPLLTSDSIIKLKSLLLQSIEQFHKIDYIQALWRLPLVNSLLDVTRERAYQGGAPTINRPGGGTGADSASNLDLKNTTELLQSVSAISIKHRGQILKIAKFIKERENSLVFYPTRITAHAGDPYVGMIGYYDIAFCRVGKSTRERNYNLVAYCNDVSISEVETTMLKYNEDNCPFQKDLSVGNIESYSYHLKHGCKLTKIKPMRIYSELADLVVFKDGIIFNVG